MLFTYKQLLAILYVCNFHLESVMWNSWQVFTNANFAMNPLWNLLAMRHKCPFCHEFVMRYSWQFCISICNFCHESIMKIYWQFFKYANFAMNPLCETLGNSSYMPLLTWMRYVILLAILHIYMQFLSWIHYENLLAILKVCKFCHESVMWNSWQFFIYAPFAMNTLCNTLGNSAYLFATFTMNPLWKSLGNFLSMQILAWIRYVKLLAILHICNVFHKTVIPNSALILLCRTLRIRPFNMEILPQNRYAYLGIIMQNSYYEAIVWYLWR